jgi:ABC-type uncharacterized transport system auxiliary subunit
MPRFVLWLLLTSCALTEKSEPLPVSYYSVVQPKVTETAPVAADAPRVRLGRVYPASHLRSRVVHRESATELGMYESRRWAESPHETVRRALERAMFARGLLATGGTPFALEVEVFAFEEVRAPHEAGRVGVRYRLIEDRVVIADDVIVVDRPATADFTSVVTAISQALAEVSRRVTEDVADKLPARTPERSARRARSRERR